MGFSREISRLYAHSHSQPAAAAGAQLWYAAKRTEDLRIRPGNRLEALFGDRHRQHSIRINDRWRICFEWREGAAWNVEVVDYHKG